MNAQEGNQAVAKDDPVASFRFAVEIDGTPIGAFTECTLPNFEIETEQIKEGGRNDMIHVLPGRGKPGNLTLKHGVMINDQFMKWAYQVMVNAFGEQKHKSVTVIMYGVDHKPIYRFEFDRAFPVKWQGPQFQAGQSAVAVETVEIAHHGVTYLAL